MSIRFEPRDIWVGLFWDPDGDVTHYYVCLVPCVVIHWRRLSRAARRERSDQLAAIDAELPRPLDDLDRRS